MTTQNPNEPDNIRQRLKTAYTLIDKTYVEMGRDLYSAFHGRLFAQWGFDSFDDYVVKELGMDRKKAERVRGIHTHFVKALGLSPTTVEKIGFFNCLTVKTCLTGENAKERVATILTLTSSRAVAKQAAAWKKEDAPDDEDEDEDEDGKDDEDEDDTIRTLTVKLHPSQNKVVQAALDEARRAKATELPDNEALANISTEFLASRMAKEDKPMTRLSFMLSVMERVYGGKIVWIPSEEAAAVLTAAMESRPDLFGDALANDDEEDIPTTTTTTDDDEEPF